MYIIYYIISQQYGIRMDGTTTQIPDNSNRVIF